MSTPPLVVKKLASLWRSTTCRGVVENRVFHLPSQASKTSTFRMKYDCIQEQLEKIAGMDNLISGKIDTCMIIIVTRQV